MNVSVIPIIKELERLYDAINLKFGFNYPKPVIVIQTQGRQKNTKGWFDANRWTQNKTEIGEITICAEFGLNKNPVETLIHEMAHYANHCEKKDDCNDQGYHNKEFKIKAENYGLNVEKDGRKGWAYTTLSEKLNIILKDLKINQRVFDLYRQPRPTVVSQTKMKKWKCDCTIVRAAVDVKATCKQCGKDFLIQ
jgi:hypothetical protein